ncbi:hypothetical protein BASA84_000123 [Batrachochytrium salamandrivorans]|nr:hypothetical protein BASA84_000123 [Batrachochytrium salamandrivorans]
MLMGSDGKSDHPANKDEIVAFANSWRVKDEDVLESSDTRTLHLSIQEQPGTMCKSPVNPQPDPVDPVPPPPTSTTAATAITTTTTTTTTTISSTATIFPSSPTPDGYVPPAPPPPDVASGSYVFSDKVKQTYLAKCHTLTDDMIRDLTKEVIDQGTKIRKECGFGNGTCINSCSGKGTCTDFGCACSPGFSGVDCSMDLTKATQYDPTVNEYRINVNITIVQEQTEQHSKLPVSVPYATPAPSVPSVLSTPSVDQSLVSFVSSLPKPSAASPQIAKKSQPSPPDSYGDFQQPIISSAISFGSLHMVSAAAVVITSYILIL